MAYDILDPRRPDENITINTVVFLVLYIVTLLLIYYRNLVPVRDRGLKRQKKGK